MQGGPPPHYTQMGGQKTLYASLSAVLTLQIQQKAIESLNKSYAKPYHLALCLAPARTPMVGRFCVERCNFQKGPNWLVRILSGVTHFCFLAGMFHLG